MYPWFWLAVRQIIVKMQPVRNVWLIVAFRWSAASRARKWQNPSRHGCIWNVLRWHKRVWRNYLKQVRFYCISYILKHSRFFFPRMPSFCSLLSCCSNRLRTDTWRWRARQDLQRLLWADVILHDAICTHSLTSNLIETWNLCTVMLFLMM